MKRTFFQLKKNRKLIWPMEVTAEPLFGWSLQEILNTPSISAVDDIYGRLYFHLHRVLGSFLDRLEKSQISFRVLNYDAFSLPMLLRADYFSRIDVSKQLSVVKPITLTARKTDIHRSPTSRTRIG